MPYSILGYHPGSLRVARVLELAELAPLAFSLELPADDDAVRHVQVDSCRVFALEGGHVLLDADGWLDALLGAGLDDSWTLGFVTARTEGELVGLAVSLGRDGRRIYGEFDFRADKVLAHGRPLANALSRICELAGADVKQVTHGMGLDRRIGPSFLNAGVGYGGSCFPKDVDAFVHIADLLGYDFQLLREVQNINKTQREYVLKKVRRELWVVQEKKIAIIGLAFKPGTDDIREAPSLYFVS